MLKLKKIGGYGILLISIFLFSTNINAATTLPAEVDGVITLTEDVSLTSSFEIAEGKTLKIDLNGFTLNGPSGSGYALDNKGNLTVVDNGSTKGKIECTASSACVHNGFYDETENVNNVTSKLNIDGVTINSTFIAVKTEPDGVTTINNSNMSSTYDKSDTGTIMNWGTTTINNSEISGNTKTPAIYATSSSSPEVNSVTNVNNSTLSGKYGVYSRRDDSGKTTQTINIAGGTINNSIQGTSTSGVIYNVTGDVKASASSVSSLLLASNNANIILTENLSGKKLTVKSGSTFTIAEGVTYTLTGSNPLIVEDGATLDNKGTLKATAVVDNDVKGKVEYYSTLQNAVKFIGDGTKVTVINDSTETKEVKPYSGKDITIDLNGHTVSGTITNPANGTMTLTDSSDDKTGKFDGPINNDGTMTINSGNYTNAPVTGADATTSLTGGTYPIDNIADATVPDNMELVDNGNGAYELQYKDADYTKVEEAIEAANALNKDEYTNFNVVEDAVNAVVTGKKVDEQAEVDSYAQAILDAIASLQKAEIPPQTFDGITGIIALGLISLFALLASGSYIKRTNN